MSKNNTNYTIIVTPEGDSRLSYIPADVVNFVCKLTVDSAPSKPAPVASETPAPWSQRP